MKKTWADFEIDVPVSASGEIATLCPQCSHLRKKSRVKCLSVNIEKEVWVCQHCAFSGTLKGGTERKSDPNGWKPPVYARPDYVVAPPTDPVLAWCAARALTEETVTAFGVTAGEAYFPDLEEWVTALLFPYYRGSEVVNVKSRSLEGKSFRQVSGAEKIFFNLNATAGAAEAWITEGELDAMACWQVGVNAMSVPDGAPALTARPSDKKYEYLLTCHDQLEPLLKIILATDNDPSGDKLANELARRLGVERCWRVHWPAGIKDANQCLMELGAETLRWYLDNPTPWPIDDLLTLHDVATSLVDAVPPPPRLSTGWPNLDEIWGLSSTDSGRLILVSGWPSHGKALALDTPIPTPQGWSTMGDLKVGDEIFNERGQSCRVTRTTDVMHGHDCYELQFADGTTVVADADHQWLTSARADRISAYHAQRNGRTGRPLLPHGTDQSQKRTYPSVKTTRHIAATVTRRQGLDFNHQIALAEPLDMLSVPLPIHPYVLGAWLGDGSAAHGGFTSNDPEIIQRIEQCGYVVTKWGSQYAWGIDGLAPTLRGLNLLKNKHIPRRYLRASVDQRRDLLAGLMDTDGSCTHGGQTEFSNTNQLLAEQVCELASSLGMLAYLTEGRARLYGKDCGPKYRVCVSAQVPIFHLARKAARQRAPRRGHCHRILACMPVPSVPVRCIEVDSPSHLYLCTRACIPTHNSEFTDALILNTIQQHSWPWLICSPENMPAEDYLQRMIERETGKEFYGIPPDERLGAIERLTPFLFLLNPEDMISIDTVLKAARALVLRVGLRGIVIDPWNEFDHSRGKETSETEYTGMLLGKLRRFARLHGVQVIVVAHPTKLTRNKDGTYPKPTPRDVSGSAHWFNKPDDCVMVWRDTDISSTQTEVHVQKVRGKRMGKNGEVALFWDYLTGRYSSEFHRP